MIYVYDSYDLSNFNTRLDFTVPLTERACHMAEENVKKAHAFASKIETCPMDILKSHWSHLFSYTLRLNDPVVVTPTEPVQKYKGKSY